MTKKLFFVLFLFAALVGAGNRVANRGVVSGGYTLIYDGYVSGSGTGAWPLGSEGNFFYAGVAHWSDSTARTIGKVTAKMTGHGSISGKTFTCKIWSVTGGGANIELNSVLATSDAVTGVDAWSLSDVDFIFSTPYTTAGGSTNYHITFEMSGAVSGTNYADLFHQNTSAVAGNISSWTSAPAAVNDNASFDLQIKIYTTP